jgi:galactonate dehydratase
VRDAVGPDFEIFIEMHGRFNPATAIELARELEPFDPGWIEEPVPPENLRALKKVADKVNLPVATGERLHTRYECRELFELQACDILQIDITHFGGIAEARKLSAWAEAYYVLMAPHNVCGPVGTVAALHLDACTPNFKIQEHFNDFADAWVKQAVSGFPEVVDGYFGLPEGPGLGITLNEAFVAEHPRQSVHFDLFADDWHKRQATND